MRELGDGENTDQWGHVSTRNASKFGSKAMEHPKHTICPPSFGQVPPLFIRFEFLDRTTVAFTSSLHIFC
jgi:hypothetical protein